MLFFKKKSLSYEAHTIIFTFFQGFLRLVQAPRVYPGGRLCIVAEYKQFNQNYLKFLNSHKQACSDTCEV